MSECTMKYPNEEDKCPLCGATAIKHMGAADPDDGRANISTCCTKCGASWVQWYDTVFAGNTNVRDKNGVEVLI